MKHERTIRLAPLVPESDIISAQIARIVREQEERNEWDDMDASDIRTVSLLNYPRAS